MLTLVLIVPLRDFPNADAVQQDTCLGFSVCKGAQLGLSLRIGFFLRYFVCDKKLVHKEICLLWRSFRRIRLVLDYQKIRMAHESITLPKLKSNRPNRAHEPL